MTATDVSLLLVPVWPGLLGLVTLACRERRLGGLLAVSGALPALGVALDPPLSYEATYSWILLGTRFGVDEADAVILLFTAVVWLSAAAFAFGWMRRGQGRERFFALFLLTMSGNLGALVAQDMPSFYALFALMSFSGYGLVAHELTREARHAANVYVVLVVIGEAAIAAAMIFAAGALGAYDFLSVRTGLESLPLRHLIIALAFLGFGIKAGVLILHVWLPLAHPVAPVPASAVLSGTIIVTGLVGWMRFLPVGEWALPGWGGMCISLGFAAAFYGAIVGTDQRDPKVVLAYSSISQMGIMTVGLGMMLLEPAAAGTLRVAVALFALHHGLAKSALFLGAGLGRTGMNTARRRALVVGLALPCLALAGAPLTSGMVVKSGIVAGEAVLPERWASAMHVLLPLTSVATALLMARFLVLVNTRPAAEQRQVGRGPWLIWCTSVAVVFFLPLWLTPTARFSWTTPAVLGSLWPLGVALAVALVAIGIWRRAGRPHVPEIPAGDMLLPMERLTLRVRNALRSASTLVLPLGKRLQAVKATGRGLAWPLIQNTRDIEFLLNRWRVALPLALVVGAVLALLAV